MVRVALVIAIALTARPSSADLPLATTANDFRQPGTQPSAMEFDDFITADPLCSQCHGGYALGEAEPFDGWVTSMMAQSARDPLMRAAASIVNADATGAGETCIRCHSPIGWLGGRSTSGDLGALEPDDFDGVNCHVCHRQLDPITRSDAPAADAAITSALAMAGVRPDGWCAGATATSCTSDAQCGGNGPCLVRAGQGRFVIDPDDARRGPTTVGFHLHPTTVSPFHQRAEVCAPCHDVSTPTYTRAGDGTYVLNSLDAAHPTQDPNAMFPEQRTFSEWRASALSAEGTTCQDCHMAPVTVAPCVQSSARAIGGHTFTGANTWVLGAVLDEYGAASGLTADTVDAAHARTEAMLAGAAEVATTQHGYTLAVRVTNLTGHKLPTGYPEGRRMWLGVRFFAGEDSAPIAEDGAYDAATATLDVPGTTRIYEVRQEIDDAVAQTTGLAAGTAFHLALSNVVARDNRIPPRGFTQAAFAVFGGAPVGASYADGQHWDDVAYQIPLAATRAEVSLYYQTTSREYAEFLRDTSPDASGQNAYDRWVDRGKSAPVVMHRSTLTLTTICTPDDAPCDDANACTTSETCVTGACENGVPVVCCSDTITGLAALTCVHDALGSSTACSAPLPGGVRRVIAKRLRKARKLARTVMRQQDRGNTAGMVKALDALDRLYAALGAKIEAAATSTKPAKQIDAGCAAALRTFLERGASVTATLRP